MTTSPITSLSSNPLGFESKLPNAALGGGTAGFEQILNASRNGEGKGFDEETAREAAQHFVSKGQSRPKKPAFDRADRDRQNLGDSLIVQFVNVAKHQHCPQILIQRLDGAV